jgi:hypothetical protein
MVRDSTCFFFPPKTKKVLTSAIDGHYLNLPVMNNEGEIVGMVDVLKLTYATLEQVNTMAGSESLNSVS